MNRWIYSIKKTESLSQKKKEKRRLNPIFQSHINTNK